MLIKININDRLEHKLKYIQQDMNLSTPEIIEQALDLFYEKLELSEEKKEDN